MGGVTFGILRYLSLYLKCRAFSLFSFGISHDGGKVCPDGVNIMATGASGGEGELKWSPCSGNALQQFLRLVTVKT